MVWCGVSEVQPQGSKRSPWSGRKVRTARKLLGEKVIQVTTWEDLSQREGGLASQENKENLIARAQFCVCGCIL